MNVIVLNGSPRVERSNTQQILEPLMAGMRKAGAEVEHFYVSRLEINPCTGCFGCWKRTPGRCNVYRDDMDMLIPKYTAADIVVFGFPLYVFTIPALVKNLLERLLPTTEPWLVPHPELDGVTTHPRRHGKPGRLFLVSTAGLAEESHFDVLLTTFRHICRMTQTEFAGHILKPGAELLKVPALRLQLNRYFATVRNAGAELIQDGRVSEKTQARLRMNLMPGGVKRYNAEANKYWVEKLTKYGHPAKPPLDAPMPKKLWPFG